MVKVSRGFWFLVLLAVFCGIASAQLPVTDDTYIASGVSTQQGTQASMAIQAPTSTALIRLDLSRLPAGTTASQVTKATVKLYATAVAVGGNVDVCEVNGSWQEKVVTYSTKPALGFVVLQADGTTQDKAINISTSSASHYVIL